MLCKSLVKGKAVYYFDNGRFSFMGKDYRVIAAGYTGEPNRKDRKFKYTIKDADGVISEMDETYLIKKLLTEYDAKLI